MTRLAPPGPADRIVAFVGARRIVLATAVAAVALAAAFSLPRGAVLASSTPLARPHSPLADEFLRGVNHADVYRKGHGYGSAASAQELGRLRDLGVDWIAISPFGFQRGAQASELADPERSKWDQAFVDEIASAHKLGLRVMLKPQIWSSDFGGGTEWHGTIRQATPGAHASWWSCYRAFALHQARLAERSGVDLYCIGTELVRMTPHEAEWRELVVDIRKIYKGPLTYAAHWDQELDRIAFWNALDFVGVSAYFPLDRPDTASVDELVAAWAPHRDRLSRIAKATGKKILFAEAGYRDAAGTWRTPWAWSGGATSADSQTRAYEALFRALGNEPWWKGVFLWKTFTDPALIDPDDGEGFSFRGKPAEQVVRHWFGGSSPASAKVEEARRLLGATGR